MKAPSTSTVGQSCQFVRIHRFEPPSRSKFIIFQGEHKGPKNEILISGAPKSLVPGFHTTCVISSGRLMAESIKATHNNWYCTVIWLNLVAIIIIWTTTLFLSIPDSASWNYSFSPPLSPKDSTHKSPLLQFNGTGYCNPNKKWITIIIPLCQTSFCKNF